MRAEGGAGNVSALGTVVVIAKQPIPGRVKTRLTPPLTPEQAAALAAAALYDTLATAELVPTAERVLAFEGQPEGYCPPGWRSAPQPGGGLDLRLAAAFAACSSAPAVLIGMDTPQVTAAQVSAFDPSRFDACLGPAVDGGYWAIGFADPADAATTVPGVPMSTAHTASVQLERLRGAGLRVQMLDTLLDVDTIDAALEVARLAPGSRFAAALSAVV